jgi:phage terminase large subunit
MINVNVSPSVFNRVYLPYLDNMARTQIYYGGAASGKSIFAAQRDVYDILKGGRNFLICRQVARTVRKSVYAEIKKIIRQWGLVDLFDDNKSEMIITCKNGYQFHFAGLDDVDKLKSITPDKGVITDIRVEEATEASQASIKQLMKRQRGGDSGTAKRLTLWFNPIIKSHWIYNEYFKPNKWADNQTEFDNGRLTILKTTYKDNQFLTNEDKADYENETDKYMYDVYTLGNWGVLGNVIFKNWRVADLSEMRERAARQRYGLDFGFGADPAAYNETLFDKGRNTLYIFDEFQGHGLSNQNLATIIKPKIGGNVLYCDSAEPKSIKELNSLGIRAIGAKKGKDSIQHGYRWLAGLDEIVIDSSCIHTANEFSLHKWKEDKYGDPLPVPEDKNNHHIDEIRYQYEDITQSNKTSIGKYA